LHDITNKEKESWTIKYSYCNTQENAIRSKCLPIFFLNFTVRNLAIIQKQNHMRKFFFENFNFYKKSIDGKWYFVNNFKLKYLLILTTCKGTIYIFNMTYLPNVLNMIRTLLLLYDTFNDYNIFQFASII
jgi:hypothetical protein